MKTVSEYTELRIPTWALSYLVNGDASGISEGDKTQVDAYMLPYYIEAQDKGGSVIFSPTEEEGSFTHSPEFGLACDCVDCTILIIN